MAPRETENNAYSNFWDDKQRALWYVMEFLEWTITVAAMQQLMSEKSMVQETFRTKSLKLWCT